MECKRSDPFTVHLLLRSLRGLAEVDACFFRDNPAAHARYFQALQNTIDAAAGKPPAAWRIIYAREQDTCGKANCWNTWRELVARGPAGPIYADCKALSAAHAGASIVLHPERDWYVGIRVGCQVGHAVAGVRDQGDDGEIQCIDTCLPAGMPPLSRYDGFRWEKVRDR